MNCSDVCFGHYLDETYDYVTDKKRHILINKKKSVNIFSDRKQTRS